MIFAPLLAAALLALSAPASANTNPADPESEDETVIDFGDDSTGCADPRIRPGALIGSLELTDRDGERVAGAIAFAPTRR